jgi:hypothetical protein
MAWPGCEWATPLFRWAHELPIFTPATSVVRILIAVDSAGL